MVTFNWGVFSSSKTVKKPIVEEKSTLQISKTNVNDIIEEIHKSFYTEVDSLLMIANNQHSLETDKQVLIDKCNKLRALGFTNTKEVIEAQSEISRLDKLKTENAKKQDLINAIDYFSVNYPNYKFITEDSVLKICEKYGLVYSTVNHYIGTVPDKNLQHIQDFQIKDEDKCAILVDKVRLSDYLVYLYREEAIQRASKLCKGNLINTTKHTVALLPLEIVAPLSDFNLQDKQVENFKLSYIPKPVPDPVVLQPVFWNGQKHYLIITAWGLEASDELIVNEKLN